MTLFLLIALQILVPSDAWTVTADVGFQVVWDHDNYSTTSYALVVDEVTVLTKINDPALGPETEPPPLMFNHKLPEGLYRVRVDAYMDGYSVPSKTIHIYASKIPSTPKTIYIK